MIRPAARLSLLLVLTPLCSAQGTRLLRQPTISDTQVAFTYANDLWVVGRDGGDALRLTSFPGTESDPCFSPDGSLVAFTGNYDGNTDVFVVSVDGGTPQRLTWHPGPDSVQGWTPDGERVIFGSGRKSAPIGFSRLYSVALDGSFPEILFDSRVWTGKLSPDGGRLAYQEIRPVDQEWRNYRGGQTHPIWILNLYDHSHIEIPSSNTQEWYPVWVGEDVYFLSDRDLAMNLYRYVPGSREVMQLTHFTEFDAKELESNGKDALVYEVGGYLHVYDVASGTSKQLAITVKGDLPWRRPHWEDVSRSLTNGSLSPTGKRAIFESRGDVFSVPVEDGDWRNLTDSQGVADRTPSWSPDGEHVAWFSDASGEYQLHIGTQDGLTTPRVITLQGVSFYYTPTWSPDGENLAFTDEGQNLWVVNAESGLQTLVDTDEFAHPQRSTDPVWSPDSAWIAYTKRLDSQYHAVFAYSMAEGTAHQLTDGMSDAISPAWDASGKYMYFLASTNFALSTGWLDMTSYERPVRRSVYVAVLSKDEPSPLLPKSDEEPAKEDDEKKKEEGADDDKEGDAKKPAGPEVKLDLEGFDQRILALGIPAGNYAALASGKEGVVFYADAGAGGGPFGGVTLHRYDLAKKESKEFTKGVSSFTLSSDRKKMLIGSRGSWRVVGTDAPPQAGKGALKTSSIRMKVDPRAEWRQIFREAWRFQRDYLYVENVHGADWDAVYRMYEPWVEHIGHRADLTYLLDILGGEVSIGHSFAGGGDVPDVERVSTGLLGADIEVDQGRYRLAHIFSGENWNPGLQAPLSAPGIDANVGDYVLAVNGREITTDQNFHAYFEGTARRQTVLLLNDRPSREGAREVTVVPVASEGRLRQRAWIEGNRRKVDELSGGRLAYVWLPDTGQGGYTAFNRYYFAQQDKPAAVIDERFNGGGSAADYMVDVMARKLHGYFNSPVGERRPFTSPQAGIWGPKVLIINESAGSGGDLLPYLFRQMGIGPLIGTTTWGGLVGIWGVPPLVDGGMITAPRGGFYDLEGEWSVENEGVAPDIKVEQTPKEFLAGGDPQLERAVQECLKLLERNPVKLLPEPDPPVRSKRPGKVR